MIFDAAPCRETVSILEAIAFGAGDACIDIGMSSLLSAIAAFVVSVLIIRTAVLWLLGRDITGAKRQRGPTIDPLPPEPDPTPDRLEPMPYESPIRSTGAWGGTRR